MDKHESQILILRDNAKTELLEIRTIEAGISHFNKLKLLDTWVRAEKKDAELQNLIAEQKLRTQRILGELIEAGQNAGEISTEGSYTGNQYEKVGGSSVSPPKKTLDDIGLNKKQSSAFKKIASIPEDKFEAFIAEGKQKVNDAVNELTTRGALRLAGRFAQSYNNNTRFTGYTNEYLAKAVRNLMHYKDMDESETVVVGLQLFVNSFSAEDRARAEQSRDAHIKEITPNYLKSLKIKK